MRIRESNKNAIQNIFIKLHKYFNNYYYKFNNNNYYYYYNKYYHMNNHALQ